MRELLHIITITGAKCAFVVEDQDPWVLRRLAAFSDSEIQDRDVRTTRKPSTQLTEGDSTHGREMD